LSVEDAWKTTISSLRVQYRNNGKTIKLTNIHSIVCKLLQYITFSVTKDKEDQTIDDGYMYLWSVVVDDNDNNNGHDDYDDDDDDDNNSHDNNGM